MEYDNIFDYLLTTSKEPIVAKKSAPLKRGDWVVHTYYGVGQIKGIEKRDIADVKSKFFIIETKNSTFFVPTDNIDNDRIRPISSKYKLKKAITELKSTPAPLETDHTQRKRQISEMIGNSNIEVSARLIRDLNARRIENGLNSYEENTLTKMTGRMIQEWSISETIDIEKAKEKLEAILHT